MRMESPATSARSREPWQVTTESGTPFKVFTPFWRRSRALGAFDAPHAAPRKLHAAPWPQDAPARVEDALDFQ